MSNRTLAVLGFLAIVGCTLVIGDAVRGQSIPSSGPATAAEPRAFRDVEYAFPGGSVQFRLGSEVEPDEMQELRAEDRKLEGEVEARLREYSRAEDRDAKDDARSKLSDALGRQFEVRQKMRDLEIARLEEQIKQLRELFQKREDAKGTIVEARLDQLVRAAEGLGWDGSQGVPKAGDFGAGVFAPATVPRSAPARRR